MELAFSTINRFEEGKLSCRDKEKLGVLTFSKFGSNSSGPPSSNEASIGPHKAVHKPYKTVSMLSKHVI